MGALVSNNFGPTDSSWRDYVPDLILHIGEVSGDYAGHRVLKEAKTVWRISEDGEIRDLTRKLSLVYHGDISSFLSNVKILVKLNAPSFYEKWKTIDLDFRLKFKNLNLPFSNIWAASILHNQLPKNSVISFAILNSLRCWNFFELDPSIRSFSNVGGFGIDGCMSTAIGGALAARDRLHFFITGDLAFFYDLNSLANRHLPKNLRIFLINNGGGIEFKNYSHMASEINVDSNELIAAGGHFNSSSDSSSSISGPLERSRNSLAKVWCEKLNFDYYSVCSKEDLHLVSDVFVSESGDRPIIIEAFTNDWEESLALKVSSNFEKTTTDKLIQEFKKVLPKKSKEYIKSIIKK
jgi:2-succinyl-5-enolpyruvyl-6-hydroxy-3-cyclohexene-1-carboxylate synthase